MVYEIECIKCQSKYIGSTIRFLHERAKEHINNAKSSVSRHLEMCNNKTINIKIIIKEQDPVNLRLLEAQYIKTRRPSINSRDEYKELRDLLF